MAENKSWLDSLPIIKTFRENQRLRAGMNQKFYTGFETGNNLSGLNTSDSVSSLFAETFQAGWSGKNYNANPRAMMETYKMIYYAFPVFMSAISIRKKALGEPELKSDDDGMQRDLDWLSENLPITNWKNPYRLQRGLCSLKDRLYTGALTKGTSFCQLKRDESMNPLSVELFRSEWFTVQKNMYGVTEFIFNSENGSILLLPDGDFQIYSQTVGDWDWGIPMAYGAEYFAWLSLRKLENNNNFDARIASGSMMFLLSGDIRNKESGVVDQTIMDKMSEKAVKWKTAIDSGLKHSNNTGRPWNLVDTVPIDAKLDSMPFGQGVSGPNNVPEIIELLMKQLLLKTEVPNYLLNDASAGGMNTDLYREQSAQFKALISGDREGIEPHLKYPVIQWLIANGASPKTIKSLRIEWDCPNTQDLKLKADTDLVSAQAVNQQLMNIAEIMNAGGGGASKLMRQYLEEIGWDESIASELDISIPEPPQA